jgi:hypothetical protein
LINCCWFGFKWGLVLLALGATVAVPYLYHRVDEEIRSRIESKLATHFPNMTVRVRFAQLVEGEGIEVRGISIVENGAVGPQAELAYFDEMFLSCQTSLQELIQGEPEVTRIKLRRPVLRATRRPDESWSIVKLFPFPRFGNGHPETTIENGTIEIFDPLKNPSSTLTLRDIHLTVRPTDMQSGDVEPVLFEGYMAADQFQRVELKGRADRRTSRWQLTGKALGLEISPELRSGLPREIAEKLAALGSLRCEGRLDFQVSHDVERTQKLRFDITANVNRGRIDDPRLPFSLSDLRARVRLDNAGYTVEDLQARNGQASIRVSGQRRGYSVTSPAELEVTGDRIALDQSLVRVLPESIRNEWYKFLPEGEVDAHLKLVFDGARWTPEADIRCLNVSFTCHRFPYRLERATGTIAHKDRHCTVHLTAYSGGQPIRINADVIDPGPQFTGSIQAEGDNIPFDEKLFSALQDSSRSVVRALNPRGTFNFFARQWRDDSQRKEVHSHLVLGLNRCTVNYERFPYPLGNIRGAIEMIDGAWTFRGLEANNDTGQVTCQGRLTPEGTKRQLQLTFVGENVPLEEELRDALPPNMGRLWNSLKPRGAVDLNIDLVYDCTSKHTNIKLRARPRSETSSLEPIYFPYRLEKFRGTIHYQDGHTELENVEAVHGRTLVSTGGTCDIAPDGGFHLRLKNLAVDRLKADHELIAALPEALKRVVGELKPSGAINVRGNVDFSKSGDPNALLESSWDVIFDAQQAALDAGIRLENLYGGVKLAGSFDGKQFYSRGELALDAATYKNFQFTEISGPLWIDNGHVLLGAGADTRGGSHTPRRVAAKIFGGTVRADCQVNLGATQQYTLRAALTDANLAQFAKENVAGRQRLDGKVLANVELQGTGRSTQTLRGSGSIRMTDADIYELPVMVALLKIINMRQPDTTAFTNSDIDFRIQGEHLLLDRINFSGDAISLLGLGQVNFDRQINLTFHSIVGRPEYQVPILRNVLGEASQQIMQIRVEGTIDNPTTRSEAFPRVSQAIQKLQSELKMNPEPPPAPPPPPPPAAQTGGLLRSLNPRK